MSGDPCRNPDLRCARQRSVDFGACGHRQSEHAPRRCFGVVQMRPLLPVNCWCPGFVEPPDGEPTGRDQQDA